jgi:hypothetical protein
VSNSYCDKPKGRRARDILVGEWGYGLDRGRSYLGGWEPLFPTLGRGIGYVTTTTTTPNGSFLGNHPIRSFQVDTLTQTAPVLLGTSTNSATERLQFSSKPPTSGGEQEDVSAGPDVTASPDTDETPVVNISEAKPEAFPGAQPTSRR